MTGDFDALVDRIATEGLAEDETLHSLLDRLRGAVAHAALDHYPTREGAARALGITREGFYKIRRRHGLPTNGNGPKPIPADYRERMSSAPSPSPVPHAHRRKGVTMSEATERFEELEALLERVYRAAMKPDWEEGESLDSVLGDVHWHAFAVPKMRREAEAERKAHTPTGGSQT